LHEEISEKIIGISFRAGKAIAAEFAKALKKALNEMETGLNKGLEKRNSFGKTSMKELMEQSGGNVSNIEITDKNIGSFDPVARKYGLKYSLKKAEKGRYYVFFKGSSVDAMTAAFREFTQKQERKASRPSVRGELKKLTEQVKNMAKTKTKYKDRGQEL